MKLCKNLNYYLDLELEFIETSKRDEINERRKSEHFPLAKLGDIEDIEINFQHYKSKEEALSKLNRRKNRINFDNLYFKLDKNYGATYEDLVEFDNLPQKNILVITKNYYPELKNAVYFKDFSLKSRMENYRKYFDVVEWLNTGKIERS